MVSNTKKFICNIPNTFSKEYQCYPVHRSNSRAMQKSKVEAICLEDIWKTLLMNLGWSERSAIQFSLQWAASTLCLYNRYVNRLQLFCAANCISFPPESLPLLVDFLCLLADGSDRPKAVLNNALQAIKHLHAAMGLPSPVADGLLPRLIVVLIKSGTKAPATKLP